MILLPCMAGAIWIMWFTFTGKRARLMDRMEEQGRQRALRRPDRD